MGHLIFTQMFVNILFFKFFDIFYFVVCKYNLKTEQTMYNQTEIQKMGDSISVKTRLLSSFFVVL